LLDTRFELLHREAVWHALANATGTPGGTAREAK